MVKHAESAPALTSFIDPGAPEFLLPGDHPAHVRAYCEKTGQPIPEDEGSVVRTILESLALEYRTVFDRLVKLTGMNIDVIHILGGGTQNHLLNQLTANATGRQVVAGPIEATVIGNALVQFIALGVLEDLNEARKVVIHSGELNFFEPEDTVAWEEAYQRYTEL